MTTMLTPEYCYNFISSIFTQVLLDEPVEIDNKHLAFRCAMYILGSNDALDYDAWNSKSWAPDTVDNIPWMAQLQHVDGEEVIGKVLYCPGGIVAEILDVKSRSQYLNQDNAYPIDLRVSIKLVWKGNENHITAWITYGPENNSWYHAVFLDVSQTSKIMERVISWRAVVEDHRQAWARAVEWLWVMDGLGVSLDMIQKGSESGGLESDGPDSGV